MKLAIPAAADHGQERDRDRPKAPAGFTKIPNEIFKVLRFMRGHDVAVYLYLAWAADNKTRIAKVLRRKIADYLGRAETRVSESFTRLEQLGLIYRHRGPRAHGFYYWIVVPLHPKITAPDCPKTADNQERKNRIKGQDRDRNGRFNARPDCPKTADNQAAGRLPAAAPDCPKTADGGRPKTADNQFKTVYNKTKKEGGKSERGEQIGHGGPGQRPAQVPALGEMGFRKELDSIVAILAEKKSSQRD